MIRAALYDEIPAPMRAAWHRDAGRALAQADAPADRVARQLLPTVGGSADDQEPMDDWILRWLDRTASLLVGQAPRAAAELLRYAVAKSAVGSAQHDRLICRLAEALYRVGDASEAERVAHRGLAAAVDPDLVADLHWTLAQCRTLAGRFPESLATLNQALAHPGISARNRARLLVAIARTHRNLGQVEMAGQVAEAALAEATGADDDWAVGWALHVLTIVAVMQGQMTDALPLFDRALTVTQAEPALTDLRLLLQVNKAVTLGDLDQYEGAFAAARQAQQLADRAGLVVRRAQAQSCLGQLLFHTGRWDDALAEVGVVQEVTKDPGVACCDHGIAAVICFHRGETSSARRHLAAAAPHAKRIGNRVVGPLVLARSEALEQEGALTEALDVLIGFADDAEEVDEVEDLLADGVRLATKVAMRPPRGASQTGRWPWPMTPRSRTARRTRCTAGGWLTRTPAGCSGLRTAITTLAARSPAPRRSRLRRTPWWIPATVTRPGLRSAAQWTSTPPLARAVTSPGCRPSSGHTGSGGRRG